MSNTEPNDDELTPAGLRRNRLTLCYRNGQKQGQEFAGYLGNLDPQVSSEDWTATLAYLREPPLEMRGEDREAWEAGFDNGRHAGSDGDLSPSPYLETKGAAKA